MKKIICFLFFIKLLNGAIIDGVQDFCRDYRINYLVQVHYKIMEDTFGELYKIPDPVFWSGPDENVPYSKFWGNYLINYYTVENKILFSINKKIDGNLLWETSPTQYASPGVYKEIQNFNLWLKYKISKKIWFELNGGERFIENYKDYPDWYLFSNAYGYEKELRIYRFSIFSKDKFILLKNVFLLPLFKLETRIRMGIYEEYFIYKTNINDLSLSKWRYAQDRVKIPYSEFSLLHEFNFRRIKSYININMTPQYWTVGGKNRPFLKGNIKTEIYYNINKHLQYRIGGKYYYNEYKWDNPYNPRGWGPYIEYPSMLEEFSRYKSTRKKKEYDIWMGIKITPY